MKTNPKASLREQLAIHRQSSKCSVCHKVMDPLGFGLENFDGIGRWREKEKDRPVDASGTPAGGESFRGPLELVKVLSKRQDAFRRHLARTLLTYALGRGLSIMTRALSTGSSRLRASTEIGFRFWSTKLSAASRFLKRRGSGARNGS